MGEFSEHIRILVLAEIVFAVLFVIAYARRSTRLWFPLFVVLAIIFMTISILARWSQVEIPESD